MNYFTSRWLHLSRPDEGAARIYRTQSLHKREEENRGVFVSSGLPPLPPSSPPCPPTIAPPTPANPPQRGGRRGDDRILGNWTRYSLALTHAPSPALLEIPGSFCASSHAHNSHAAAVKPTSRRSLRLTTPAPRCQRRPTTSADPPLALPPILGSASAALLPSSRSPLIPGCLKIACCTLVRTSGPAKVSEFRLSVHAADVVLVVSVLP
ncbi:hypothetical protein GUJ93_ZPchr0006g43976 [Zizania palustris]|uniref:Uncharacterized protein n=1 Tax=Zizania palustris TaxID=103762 RepID=A0A8J5VW45_ZIZPA|nr:hypothetical protein GUJ93_ZPchr0006g43976 [Zizania palustris]